MSSSLDHLGEEIAADVTHVDAAMHSILTKLRTFDAGGGYVSQGFRTCAQWLCWRVNWTLGTAREHVRVARALGDLPLIDRALECGKLSYCKVRALTRVATAANEAELLEMASHVTGHQLEKLCRSLAAAKNHDDPTGTSQPTEPGDDIDRRYVHRRDREDGMVVFEAVLHPDEADIVSAALERIAKERCRARANTDSTVVTSADDVALGDVCATTGNATCGAVSGTGDTTRAVAAAADAAISATGNGTSAADRPALVTNVSAGTFGGSRTIRVPPTTKAFDRATALVEMSQQVLRGTSPERSPVDIIFTIPINTLTGARTADIKSCSCSESPAVSANTRLIPGGRPIADPFDVALGGTGTFISGVAARRLACDAGLIALVEDADGNTLSVGRKTRTIPASIKRALQRRDCTCRFPGCNARAFLEGHHLEHWADGGPTALGNLIMLCSYHHRFVHEYGFRLELDAKTNMVSAYEPAHQRWIPAVASPSQPTDLGWPSIRRRNEPCAITADTQPTWDATPVDYAELVDIILRAEDRAGNVDPDDDTN